MIQVGRGGRERQALAQEVKLQISGVAQVIAACAAAGVGQRMFQQGQQRGCGQALAEQIGDMTQEPARCGQGGQGGTAGAVVRNDAPPAIQRGGDLAGQRPVRGGNQGGGVPVFRSLAQGGGDGGGLGTRGDGGASISVMFCVASVTPPSKVGGPSTCH